MTKLLFVIPSLATGGTNSSLDALYTHIKDQYDIRVFSISGQHSDHDYSFSEVLLPADSILSYLFTNYGDQRGFNKLISLFFKIIQVLARFFRLNLLTLASKRRAHILERSFESDYVIGYQEGTATLFASLFKLCEKIAWIHCNYNYYLSAEETEESMYTEFKRIVCVSDYTAKLFSQRYPALSDKTIAIHNLIDKDRIIRMADAPVDDMPQYPEGVILLSVGRFSSVKRFREIPAIASDLKSKGISFIWYIVGPKDDSGECTSFLNNIEMYDVNDRVKWLGGKVNPYPYFKQSNLYVCLSESEACPMVFQEAKLLGLKIVSTDFPSAYEFIHESEGIVSSFDMVADSIVKIINRDFGALKTNRGDDTAIILNKLAALFK